MVSIPPDKTNHGKIIKKNPLARKGFLDGFYDFYTDFQNCLNMKFLFNNDRSFKVNPESE